MSTLTAIFEPSADGDLRLPLPAEVRKGKFKVVAVFTPVDDSEPDSVKAVASGFGCLKGKIHMSADFDAPLDDFKEYME
jgi:hypothetical protein